MDDYALVSNAGSSSLKFCVYRRPEVENWRLESRGQIEGIGTSPRLSVKDAEGTRLADQCWMRRFATGARRWMHWQAGCGPSMAAHGSWVSGTASFMVDQAARPTVVNRQVLAELQQLIPLAPLHQPHNLAAIEAVFERLPDVPQVACFDTAFHRGQPALRSWCRCHVTSANQDSSATVFMDCLTNILLLFCRKWRRRSRRNA